jgi:hypothetical protein
MNKKTKLNKIKWVCIILWLACGVYITLDDNQIAKGIVFFILLCSIGLYHNLIIAANTEDVFEGVSSSMEDFQNDVIESSSISIICPKCNSSRQVPLKISADNTIPFNCSVCNTEQVIIINFTIAQKTNFNNKGHINDN